MQNFVVTNKEHYGMLWYFLEWSMQRMTKEVLTITENNIKMASGHYLV